VSAHDSRDPDAATAQAWLATGVPTMVVEVVKAKGSVPRGAGTRMLVRADAVAGTIGGGHLELKAIALARERLAAGDTAVLDWPVALGPSLGQCCGGAVTLRLQVLDEAQVADWPTPAPGFRLHLYGAGHVGRAVVALLATLPCEVWWIDEREDQFPDTPLPAHIHRVCVEPVQAEVSQGRPGDAYLVMTHSHDLDLALISAILARGDAGYCGLIGSATKRARFEARLRERGIDDGQLSRLVCPIGLPGLNGKEPAAIAISVTAQLLYSHMDSR